MKLITYRDQIKLDVAIFMESPIGFERRRKLNALNLDACSVADIEKACEPDLIPGIGFLKCDECKHIVMAVMRFSNPLAIKGWECFWDVCQRCLENALGRIVDR